MQDKSKLGNRYQCYECGQKFYDLNRPEPLCPKCGTDQAKNPNPDPRDAILARFKSKSGGSKSPRIEEDAAEDEELDEEAEVGEEEEIDEEEEEGEGEAAAGEEEE